MLLGDLSPTYIRRTYLRGVDLGDAWQGSAANAAIQAIIDGRLEEAQGKIGVRFKLEKILTYPDPGLELCTDYDIEGDPLPYYAPGPGDTACTVILPFTQVRSIERLRLFAGKVEQDTIAPEQIFLEPERGILQVVAAVPQALLLAQPTGTFPAIYSGSLESVYTSFFRRADVVGVWAPDYTVGLGRIPLDVAEWIGLGVAITTLSIAGAGGTLGGVIDQVLTMDGVTESTHYYQARFGRFSGAIQGLQNRLDAIDIVYLRRRYQGLKHPTY